MGTFIFVKDLLLLKKSKCACVHMHVHVHVPIVVTGSSGAETKGGCKLPYLGARN